MQIPRNDRWMVYRPNAMGLPDLPLRVRSVGRYAVQPDWKEDSPPKPFLQLFWGVDGGGWFKLGSERIRTREGDLFVYYPGERHSIRVASKPWTYCWVTFDHPDIQDWIKGFGLTERRRQVGPCPEAHFHQIAEALRACTPEGERTAAHLAHALLLEAIAPDAAKADDSLAAEAKARLDHTFANSDRDISGTADELQVHRSTLFRRFHAQYGLTPSRYLQSLRLQKAMSLLRETRLPVQEVARLSGFSDPNYFTRAIRETTGMSPGTFRKS